MTGGENRAHISAVFTHTIEMDGCRRGVSGKLYFFSKILLLKFRGRVHARVSLFSTCTRARTGADAKTIDGWWGGGTAERPVVKVAIIGDFPRGRVVTGINQPR